MILIQKNQSNQITLTLTEKCNLTNPYFLFYFRKKDTGEVVTKILADTSNYTERYNRFTFVEPTTAELLTGFWIYEVYEQASASNLDITGLNMVEQGVMKVVDPSLPVEPATYEGEETTKATYNG